ncbi:SDR family NAD(P)-dependent oxidoreductase [Pseudomonas sp. CGJS7]|uniref:SDR family NAD(P)-dependent oxidoreductase n=1 Tax=Pseudomonas sp. CGJS7 TaxID=3109348 RepID=UPI003009B292
MDIKANPAASGRVAKVAVIGAACRFPGQSNTPESFFRNLLQGQNYVGPVPEDRWAVDKFLNERDVAGKAYVGFGHFLKDYDYRGFDADFFHFSPREVEFLDPQQRLLLELSWEAMENAGLDVEALAGSQTGVFVGGFTVDHLLNQFGSNARDAIGSHSAAGATLTMLSNRVSYAFDFCGPSLSLDTACSSSLVAFAQGVTSILTGQCETALVGGANFILRPEYTIAMSKGRFLAKDGRSKSFDARADGYGRGEGGGVVVLKDLEAALRDGDEIFAIVDGAGVNQDGRTSGITVPNPEAQRALMEQVLAQSGRAASEVDYIEAHGTGTPVGDPRETRAIADVYGRDGDCVVGSVKANIGHLEAAAGVASVIKSVMMLRHKLVPPVAGLEQVNPEIPKEVRLPRETLALGEGQGERRIAINSFGYGGTNAHVILGSYAQADAAQGQAATDTTSIKLLPLSARDPQALRTRARQLADVLESPQAPELEDVLFTAGVRRTHMSHRLAVWGEDRDQLAMALRQFVADDSSATGVEGVRPFAADPRIAFVYTGMGPQWWAMGRELLRDNAVFRDTLEQADALFTRIAGFSILEEMTREEADSRIKRTEFAQPANLMIQIGLTQALKAEGIVADAVVGHSVGEVASSWASGMLSLEEALLVSRERSRIQATTAGTGGMLALGLSAQDAEAAIAPHGDLVSLAAINSPRAVTVAGDRAALEAIRVAAEANKIFARALDVEVPYHSPLMEPLKPEIREKLASLQPNRPEVALYSTVTGGLIGEGGSERGFDAEYWCDNVRNPVYFADAIGAMIDDGYTLFVEVGPHPVLRRSLEEISAARKVETRIASTLWMNKPETAALRRSLCEIYAHGGDVDWQARTPRGRQLQLPTYPWQRQPLWREASWQIRDRLDVQQAPLSAAEGGADLNLRRLNYLFDHVVDGSAIMPAAGYLEALCEEGRRRWPDSAGLSVRDVLIHQALILDHERALRLDVRFDPTTHRAGLYSRDAGEQGSSLLHTEASIHPYSGRSVVATIQAPQGEAVETIDPQALYADLGELSLQYGPAFRPIVALRRDRAVGVAEAELTRPQIAGEGAEAYILHPSLLDGCFQTALTLMHASEGAYLPVSLKALEVYAPLPETIVCRTRISERSAAQIVCDFELSDRAGTPLARIEGLVCRSLHGRGKADGFPAGDYQRVWNPLGERVAARAAVQRLLIVAHPKDALAQALEKIAAQQEVAVDRCAWSELAEHPRLHEVSHVLGLAWAGRGADMDVTGEDEIAEMLLAVQALAAQSRQLSLRVVTRDAQRLGEDERVAPAQTAVAGFIRVVRNEYASLDAATIDIAAGAADALAQQVFDEALADQIIDEIALRDDARYAAAMLQSGLLQRPQRLPAGGADSPAVELSLQAFAYTAQLLPQPALAEDAYELRVERLGLQLGHESDPVGVIGTVVRAGREAKRFAVGDRVAGLVPRRLSNALVVSEAESVLEAVTQPHTRSALIAPVEARAAAIVATCGPQPGQRALIAHGAFGDALARRFSAVGVDVARVAADLSDWERVAHCRGYDLIAVPLSQWSRQVGFFALAKGGQLIELGHDTAPFALPEHCDRLVRLRNDLDSLHASDSYRRTLREVLAEGEASPGLDTSIGFADLLRVGSDAAAEFGSDWTTLEIAEDAREFDADASDLPRLRRDGTYLLTGGFGGLGREVARWLARNGAGRIALVGRRGADTPGAAELIEELRALGAEASAHAINIAVPQAVLQLVRELHKPKAPLLGIYHAAGVLEDYLLGEMTPVHVQRVLRPKAGGAWALHEAAQKVGAPLEQFVLFSSIANLVGNSRQANYCAANGFLDGLAQLRRSQGLPALSVNFGAIAGVGMLEGDARIGQHLSQIGLTPLDVQIALRGLGRALTKQLAQIAISEQIAWEKWAAYESVGGASPAFVELVAASRAAQAGDASLVEQLHTALAGLDDGEARPILQELIAEVVAAGLKTSADRLKPEQSFDSFGVDSLMSTEIQIRLDQKLGVSYSVIELLGAATIAKLADRALADIRGKFAAAGAALQAA